MCLSSCPFPADLVVQERLVQNPGGISAHCRRATCPSKVTRKSTTKRKKRTLATPAAATAIPVKPRTAANSATTKKIKAQRNMCGPPDWLCTSKGRMQRPKSLAGAQVGRHTAEGVSRHADCCRYGATKRIQCSVYKNIS